MSKRLEVRVVAARLAARGFDGLYHPSEPCGCFLRDLFPCGERPQACRPGQAREGENGFGIYRPTPRRGRAR